MGVARATLPADAPAPRLLVWRGGCRSGGPVPHPVRTPPLQLVLAALPEPDRVLHRRRHPAANRYRRELPRPTVSPEPVGRVVAGRGDLGGLMWRGALAHAGLAHATRVASLVRSGVELLVARSAD